MVEVLSDELANAVIELVTGCLDQLGLGLAAPEPIIAGQETQIGPPALVSSSAVS